MLSPWCPHGSRCAVPSPTPSAAAPLLGTTGRVCAGGVSPAGCGAEALQLETAACGHTLMLRKLSVFFWGAADSGGSPGKGSNAPLCSTEGRPRPGKCRLCIKARH